MRILFVLHQFYPEFCGGTEKVAFSLARQAQKAGHYVQVLTCKVGPISPAERECATLPGAFEWTYKGVPVVAVPRRQLPVASDISFDVDSDWANRIAAWLKHKKYDVAHVFHVMRMATVLSAMQQVSLPYLLTITDFFFACYRVNQINLHGTVCSGPDAGHRCWQDCPLAPWNAESLTIRYQQARNILQGAALCVCPSSFLRDGFTRSFPGQNFLVLSHGVDLIAVARNSQSKVGCSTADHLTLGYIGAIIPAKGLSSLLDALKNVDCPNVSLRVIGGFYGDPQYEQEVRQKVAADSRIVLVGQVEPDYVFSELQTIDLFCLPSRVPESFSLVLQEAAATGTPALVSDLGAPAQRLAAQGGGRVLPVDDAHAWADAINEIIQDRQLLQRWRDQLSLPFRVEEEAFFYETLYRQIVLELR